MPVLGVVKPGEATKRAESGSAEAHAKQALEHVRMAIEVCQDPASKNCLRRAKQELQQVKAPGAMTAQKMNLRRGY